MTTGSRPARERAANLDWASLSTMVGGDSVDLVQLFELHARVVLDAVSHLTAGS